MMKLTKPTKEGTIKFFSKYWKIILIEMAFFSFILLLDLCLKDFLVEFLSDKNGLNYTVINGFFDLTYYENTGAGFGMMSDNPIILSVLTTVLIVGVLIFLLFSYKESEGLRIPLIMIAAGGLGNLVDRLALGYVRDFFEFTFMDFAIFNVADSFITIGAAILIVYLIYMLVEESRKSKKSYKEKLVTADSENESNENENVLNEDAVSFTIECDSEEKSMVQETSNNNFNQENEIEISDNIGEDTDDLIADITSIDADNSIMDIASIDADNSITHIADIDATKDVDNK